MARPIIVVLGATGAQGGGLVRAIAEDAEQQFAARAVTRRPDADEARALAAHADVVQGDLDDLESLTRAFEGAHGVYGVTNFWEHFSPERELTQARNIAQAAVRARVKHVVWSTLEDTRTRVPLEDARMPTLLGRYKVPHFDAKGEADRFFREAGAPTTFMRTSFYWDNFITFGMGPKPGTDGALAITFPMADRKLPGVAVEDIGRCAFGVFSQGDEWIGRTVGVAGEHLTGAEMAAAMGEALGREVRYQDVPPEVYRGFGFPGAEDLGNMFQFKRDFERDYCAARNVEQARRLNPRLQTFRDWLQRNKSRIPIG